MGFLDFVDFEVEVVSEIHRGDGWYHERKALLGKPIRWIDKEKSFAEKGFFAGDAVVNGKETSFLCIKTEIIRVRGQKAIERMKV